MPTTSSSSWRPAGSDRGARLVPPVIGSPEVIHWRKLNSSGPGPATPRPYSHTPGATAGSAPRDRFRRRLENRCARGIVNGRRRGLMGGGFETDQDATCAVPVPGLAGLLSQVRGSHRVSRRRLTARRPG